MEALQGAVLHVKLKHLDEWTDARRRHAQAYFDGLEGAGPRLIREPMNTKSVHHVFPLFVNERDRMRADLEAAGVTTGIHYPIPVHLQRAYEHLGLPPGSLPETERLCKEMLSLPMYPELTSGEVAHVTDAVRASCSQLAAAHQ